MFEAVGAFIIVEMLFSTSLLAIVGAGEQVLFSWRAFCSFFSKSSEVLHDYSLIIDVIAAAIFVTTSPGFV